MANVVKEFREFIARGNVLDLAVGVIIGGAFGKIVTSLVDDVLMPPLGAITKGINFADLFISLDGKTYETLADAKKASAPVIGYGAFFNNIIQFTLIALAVFVLVKVANTVKRKMEEEALLAKPEEPATAAKEDPAIKATVQNEKMIELLEKIAAK